MFDVRRDVDDDDGWQMNSLPALWSVDALIEVLVVDDAQRSLSVKSQRSTTKILIGMTRGIQMDDLQLKSLGCIKKRPFWR